MPFFVYEPIIMNLLLLLISFWNFDFGLSERVEVNWKGGFISYISEKQGVIVSFVPRFLTDYPIYLLGNAFSQGWKLKVEIYARERRGGIIPIIDIPVKFPKPIAGIIGQGGKLDVSGSQGIEFGGSQSFSNRTGTELQKQSFLPALEMKQHLGVNLKGTIGEKIHVFIDHDSEREFDLANTIRLQYKGFEDEIIQEINAGNTDVSLPGTRLIGGTGSHKGLFGLKALAKVGPWDITAVASKEQAMSGEKTLSGGVTVTEDTIYSNYFEKNRFFYVHPITKLPLDERPDSIVDLRIFISDEQDNPEEGDREGKAFDIKGEWIEFNDSVEAYFKEVYETEYYIFNKESYVLELNSSLYKDYILGVTYKFYKDGVEDSIGNVPSDTSENIILQTLKRSEGSDKDTAYVSWDYQLRNIYCMGGGENIDDETFEMKVYKINRGDAQDEETAEDRKTYLYHLGMETEIGGVKQVDINQIDFARGLIIFPDAEPFAGLADPDSVYNIPDPRHSNVTSSIKYYIWIKYKGIERTKSIGAMNIVSESEEVILEGVGGKRSLERGKDYTIDYDFGSITFLIDLAPTDKITINYQYVPFFRASSKTLVGARMSRSFSNGGIGASFLFNSETSMDKRPQVGAEPSQITLAEIDGSIKTSPGLITKLVDKIPFVETEAKSVISVSGEAGVSLPNPNTRKYGYIDDMESARSSASLSLTRQAWSYGSVPKYKDGTDYDTTDFAQVLWYNPEHGVRACSLYPNLPENKKNDEVVVLQLKLPDDDWRQGQGEIYWSSLLACLSRTGEDYSEKEYIELWLKGDAGLFHIDIGTDIPEDAPRRRKDGKIVGLDGEINTEDIVIKNGKIDAEVGEDRGLDTLAGEDSKSITGDDGNDDYYYKSGSGDYSKVNGTEGNQKLDTEDLNRDGFLNKKTNFFSYRVDSQYLVPTETGSSWKLFRIPLENAFDTTGSPSLKDIVYARIRVDSITEGFSLGIARMDIVGNKWRNRGIVPPDSNAVFEISIKNSEENPEYSSPPIKIEQDQYGRKMREGALVLEYKNLASKSRGVAYTRYTSKKNYMQYRALNLFVKKYEGDDLEFFIRFGGDSLNYYEYREKTSSGWQEIAIPLDTIVLLKDTTRSYMVVDTIPVRRIAMEGGSDTLLDTLRTFGDGSYFVKGTPSLTNIGLIEIGVRNGTGYAISGEIWVDEIRLTDIRKEIGYAGSFSINTSFADLLTVNFNMNIRNPYFKSIATQKNIATDASKSWSLDGRLGLNKFLPESWGLSLPLRMSLGKSFTYPKYRRNSDVVLSAEQSEEERSESFRKGGGISFSKKRSKNKFLNLTLDNISGGASYSDKTNNLYDRLDSTEIYSGNISYGYSPSLPALRFKKFEFRYYPESFNIGTNYNYNLTRGYTRTDSAFILTSGGASMRTLRTNGGFSYKPIKWVSSSYSINIDNDLNYEQETYRKESISASFSPDIWDITSQSVSYSCGYIENHGLELIVDTMHYRNISASNQISFNSSYNIGRVIKIFTGLRGRSKDKDAITGSPRWILMKVEEFASKLSKPSFRYSISRGTNFVGLEDRPDWRYRYGIDIDAINVKRNTEVSNYRENVSESRSFSISSVGISWTNISISGGYSKRWNLSGVRGSLGEPVESETKPEISVRISSIEKYLKMLKFIKGLDFSGNFSRDINKREGSQGENINMSPGFQIKLPRDIGLNLTGSIGITRDESYSADVTTTNTGMRQDYTLSSSYSFKAPEGIKLPLLRRLKFSSNLDVSISVTYGLEEKKREGELTESRVNYSMAPRASYNFSSAISGGATMNFSRSYDRTTGINTGNVGIRINAEFKF